MGNGQMLWTDGSMYEGEWINGIQHGLGRMVFPDGQCKEGYFEHNTFMYGVQPGTLPQSPHLTIQKSSPGSGMLQ